jgi:hypothetical protein
MGDAININGDERPRPDRSVHGRDLGNLRISDHYTSLLHLSGQTGFIKIKNADGTTSVTAPGLRSDINPIYDGAGTVTGLSLSSENDRVIINNYIACSGYGTPTEWLEAFYPIGSIIMTVNNNNPSGRIKGTKWCRVGNGRFFAGVGEDTVFNLDGDAQKYEFTPGIDGELLGETTKDIGSGNIAGEYGVQLEVKHLPGHNHTTNLGTQTVTPIDGESASSNAHFMFYFGPQVNPEGLEVAGSIPYPGEFLEQDRIEAFQNNSRYDSDAQYRTAEIRRRHADGYEYTDEDFRPTLGTESLDGWGSAVVDGPGWAGVLNGDDPEYITRSPRPVGVTWPDGRRTLPTTYDPRDADRVHPGTFRDSQLIAARNLIINVLGEEEAEKALKNVNRLKELGSTVEERNQEVPSLLTTFAQVPGTTGARSANTGRGAKHNNIPPSYGVYLWVRVPEDHVCNAEFRPDWYGTITRDKISNGSGTHDIETNSGQFDLGEWARNHGTEPWNGHDNAIITIAGADDSEEVDSDGNKRPVYIYSDDPSDEKAAAMVIGNFPRGLTLVNNGFIMGRGGDGGTRSFNGSGAGQAGGDAIKFTGSIGPVTVENENGAIAGGGGGGGGAGRGNFSGGGGGAGGGDGGASNKTNDGGQGGAPGEPGTQGRYYVWYLSGPSLNAVKNVVMNDSHGPGFDVVPGIGGEAGGSGGGGKVQSRGLTSSGNGGGGGRVLTAGALGGGTGGPAGAEFGGLNSDGKIKGFGDGPRFDNGATRFDSNAPTIGWTVGYCNKGNCRGRNGYEEGRPKPEWVNPVTPPHAPDLPINQNYGAVWKADIDDSGNGIPFVVASIQASGNLRTDRFKEAGATVTAPVSPTGWNGAYHFSTYIAGGAVDQPGFPLAPDASTEVDGYVASTGRLPSLEDQPEVPIPPGGSGPLGDYAGGGGGGWGASGGATNIDIPGGSGGNAVKRTGATAYTINGGIVYGTQE